MYVNEENKHDYVKYLMKYKLHKSIKEGIDYFKKGFDLAIPNHFISQFTLKELDERLSGISIIDGNKYLSK